MFLNRRNFYFQNYPYLSTYTQAQIQQYRENAIARRAKLQALREAIFEAQVQQHPQVHHPQVHHPQVHNQQVHNQQVHHQQQVQQQQRLPAQATNNNDAVTYVGGAMIDSTCGTPPNGLDFTPYGHVSRPGSTPQSYSLWGSSKGSQAESDEHLYRKRFGKSLCRVVTTCAVVLVILALLGIIGIAVYLGYISNQEDGGDPNHTSKYVGNVHIIKGDTWVPELHFTNSPPFRAKATKYKNMLQSVYEHSSLGPAIESAEVTSFNEMAPRSKGFEMSFVLNLDKRKIPFWYLKSVEAELKRTLLQELGSLSPVSFQNVKADLESLSFKKLDTDFKVQNSLIAKPKETLQLLNVGGVGGILRVKSSDVQPVAGKEIGEIIMPVKYPKPTTSVPSRTTTKPPTTKELTTTTTTAAKATTTTVTSSSAIPNPSTIRNLVYEHGPWRPIFFSDDQESETKKTKLRRPNEENPSLYDDVFDFPHFSVVDFPDFQSGENETELLYPPLDIGVIDDPVNEESFSKPHEYPYPPLDYGVLDEVPSREDPFKYGPIRDGHFETTTFKTPSPFIHPIISSPAEESSTISANVIREFLRTLFTTEVPVSTKLADKISHFLVTTESSYKGENVIEEVSPSRKDIQSVLENLFYLASFKPDKQKPNKTFEMPQFFGTEGKFDFERDFVSGDQYFESLERTTSNSLSDTKSKFSKLPHVTSYSGVRDFQRPRPLPPSPDGKLPLDRFRINAQSSTPEQPNLIPLKGKPFHLNIWDILTTEKPLILDTEVVTSTSYDVHYGAITEELRPVYIHSSTLKTLTNIINDDNVNQLTIPVISGKEVTYVRVNRTRSNYPNVVIVNMPPDSFNKTDLLESEKDGRNFRFNTKFLNDISKLISFETSSNDSGNTSVNKSSREGKPININADFIGESQKSESNDTSIWSMLSNLSRVYLSDPAILQQLYQFATATSNSDRNTILTNDLNDRTLVKQFDHQIIGPSDVKRRKSGKSLKFPPVTTLFISKDGAKSKIISVSSRSPKVSSVASKTNSPIHTFTFKEDQSLDELLAEIFEVLSHDDSNQVKDIRDSSVGSNSKDRHNHFKFSSSSVPAGEDSLKIIEELSKLLSDHYGTFNGVFGSGSTEPDEQEVQETTFQPLQETTSTTVPTLLYEIDTPMFAEVTNLPIDTTTKFIETTKYKYSTKRPTSHKYYHDLFPAMTRPMNPIKTTTSFPLTTSSKNTSVDVSYSFKSGEVMTEFHKDLNANRNCTEMEFRCRNGNCIPQMARCNMIKDCSDNSDEQTCKCSDILVSQHYVRKICDGIIDCWDKSDEINCDWCGPGKFICTGYRQCVEPENVCDGVPDCPNGEDERDCVTISPNDIDASRLEYFNEGYLMVRKNGLWGKLCFDNFEKSVAKAGVSWSVADLGEAVCNTLTFDSFKKVENITDTTPPMSRSADPKYYEIDITSDSRSKSRLRSLELSTHINSKRSLSRTLSGNFLRNELSHELKGSLKTFASLLQATPFTKDHRIRRDATDFDLSLQFQGTDCPDKSVVKVNCAELQCGVRPRATTLQARIVGGSNSSPGAWPWHAALYKEGEYQCGATLISAEWLISAGHCFYSAKHEYWVARMGALRRGTKFPSPFEQVRPIRQIFIHPDYVNQGFINDVSLLRLEDSVRLNDYVRPVCLPSPGSEVNDGESCSLVGWGQLFEEKKVFPDTLQEVEVPVISTKECRKRTVFLPLYRITEDMFCAGYDRGGRDACLGDSGGPLMCQKSDGRWEVIGVTSNGYGCARPHRPGVYTKVANYLQWINQVMELGSSGRIVPLKRQCSGLRCPLGECLSPLSICNGKIECSDGSDEKNCS